MLPAPQEMELTGGWMPVDANPVVEDLPISVRIDPVSVEQAQGYQLEVRRRGFQIVAHDEAGAFYAKQTIKQLVRQAKDNRLPCLRIADWPDFPHRGVMLDISRSKVPEMETLYGFVDEMAGMKMNELQLYMEHAFAYKGHQQVWIKSSPMTPQQVRALDAYCKERFVDLVPNQNSFGHMERWLVYPEYAPLGEIPEGPVNNNLCPTNPDCLTFLDGLYGQLLPCFSADRFNVGCDEVWMIGMGRSADAAKAKGKEQVYLDFLKQINQLVIAHGKKTMFWADILEHRPELIPEVPKDIIAINWGYAPDYPYKVTCPNLAKAGLPFYVAPCTYTVNSLLGMLDYSQANALNAAENGKANGAMGYLITDWGDSGHSQFFPVLYAPVAYAAGLCWAVDENRDMDLARVLDVHVFHDKAGVMGQLAIDLGHAHSAVETEYPPGGTAFHVLLYRDQGREFPLAKSEWLCKLQVEDFEKADVELERLDRKFGETNMDRPDAALLVDEYRCNVAMARFACHYAIARLKAGGVIPSELPRDVRLALASELKGIIPEYCALWIARNRSGGLSESVWMLDSILSLLLQGEK